MNDKSEWMRLFHKWMEQRPASDRRYQDFPKEFHDRIEQYIDQFDFNKEAIYNSHEESLFFEKELGHPVRYNGLHANRPRLRFVIGAMARESKQENIS